MISRLQIMRIHMLLAAFLLPVAAMYFVSGALYTLDIKGHIHKQVITLQPMQPLKPDLELLTQLATRTLRARNLPPPRGEPTLKKKKGDRYELHWSGLKHSVVLAFGRDRHSARLTFRERSPLTQVMRIHRAEAGAVFRALAITLAGGLLVILASGAYMGLAIPRFRKPLLIAIISGVGTLLALAVI